MDKNQHDNQQQPTFDPRMMQAMYGQYEEDEIDLLEYWKIIWGKRKFIVSSSFLAAALAAVVSLLMPNIYRAEVLLAPVGVEDSKASSLLGGLGGFASLAGVSLGGGGSTEENLAVFKSRQFIWKFIRDEKLMPTLFEDDWDEVASSWKETDIEDQPSLWDAWRLLIDDNRLSTTIDGDSGLITLAVEWTDADLSAIWANKLVERLNQHLREYAITQSKSKLAYLEQELSRTTVE